MSRDEFVAEFIDEFVGLLLRAFARANDGREFLGPERQAREGRAMIEQMKAAKELLGRIHDRLTTPAPKVLPATQPKRTA